MDFQSSDKNEDPNTGDDNARTDWFYGELYKGAFTFLRWDGWRLTIPLSAPPQEFTIVRSFCNLPSHDMPPDQLGSLRGFADFAPRRGGVFETGNRAPWFAGELQPDGVKLMRWSPWTIVIPWDTSWSEVARKFAVWSYLTGQVIAPGHVGPFIFHQWQESVRKVKIGDHQYRRIHNLLWRDAMN